MTARETLSFFAFLRGLPHDYIPDLVIALIDVCLLNINFNYLAIELAKLC